VIPAADVSAAFSIQRSGFWARGEGGDMGWTRQQLNTAAPLLKAAIGHAARTPWRQALRRRGIDVTATTSTKSCVVIAPHPDDETLGCGISIQRRRAAGSFVTVVVATDGALSPLPLPVEELVQRRRHEATRACAVLGVDAEHVIFLDLPDGGLQDNVDALATRLAEIMAQQSPDQILAPVSCEGHQDHDAANRAIRCLVDSGRTNAEVLEYPIWLWGHWPWTRVPGRTRLSPRRLLVDPVERLLEVRPLRIDAVGYRTGQRAALAEYTSQVADESTGRAMLPAWLLRALSGRYELLFPYGSLRHLDSRSSEPSGAPHRPW
jgi:LmbE family N-acetylglucosaminyl deacetylase